MGYETYIVIAVILAIVGLAAWYVIKAKKNGKKCIGCPDGCSCSSEKKNDAPASACSGNCSCCCSCPSAEADTKTE